MEDALRLHSAVGECVVMEMPDSLHRKEIVAFITLRAELTGREELRDWLAGEIGDYKIPKRIVILSELPKGLTGKVDRLALKNLVLPFEMGIDVVAS